MKIGMAGKGKLGSAIAGLAAKKGMTIAWTKGSRDRWEDILDKHHAADVAIEVSTPETAYDNCRFLLSQGLPVVCGTTGWQDRLPELEDYCREIGGSFLYASNFSIGVNVLFDLNRRLARLAPWMDGCDVAIREIHHIHKKDAPSGTALTLSEPWLSAGKYKTWTLDAQNTEEALPIEAIREGEVYGLHEVHLRTPIDHLILSHEALSREGFASGALLAAGWLPGRKGVFRMSDLLDEKMA
jgi:4-hydroxy-tetrahydrodipicolinate reductase